MKEEFDFKQIKKEMPYRVPPRFFDEMENEIVEQALNQPRKTRTFPFRRYAAVVLSAAALIAGLVFFIDREEPQPLPDLDASLYLVEAAEAVETDVWDEYMRHLTDEELEEAMDLMNLDVFMED